MHTVPLPWLRTGSIVCRHLHLDEQLRRLPCLRRYSGACQWLMLWLMLSATQPSSAEVAIAYIRPAASVISFAFAGNTTCDSKFAFGVPSADECIYDSGLQISLCWHFWEDHGGDDAHVRRCSTAADCPLRFAAVQCSLQPSGGPAQRPPNARSPRDGRVSCCRCRWFFYAHGMHMRSACVCAGKAMCASMLCTYVLCHCMRVCGAGALRALRALRAVCVCALKSGRKSREVGRRASHSLLLSFRQLLLTGGEWCIPMSACLTNETQALTCK